MESSSLANGARLGDPFSASVGSGTNPHGGHFYSSMTGMSATSPPSLDTLGLGTGSNGQGHAANLGLPNGIYKSSFSSFCNTLFFRTLL